MFMPKASRNLSLEKKVDLLLAENEIRNIVYRDCRAKSRADVELMKTCFWEDAVDHHQPWFEMKSWDLMGSENIEGTMRQQGEMIEYWAPQILIDIDHDVARVESYIVSAKTFHERAENGDKLFRLSGMRNLDRFERRHEEWRIAERWFIGEWGFFQQVPPLEKAIGAYAAGTQTGKLLADAGLEQLPFARDRSDISYNI